MTINRGELPHDSNTQLSGLRRDNLAADVRMEARETRLQESAQVPTELGQSILSTDRQLSRFEPLERIWFYDDFNQGLQGQTALIGNYENSLDAMLSEYKDMRPPMLSNLSMCDSGTVGTLTGNDEGTRVPLSKKTPHDIFTNQPFWRLVAVNGRTAPGASMKVTIYLVLKD